MLAAKLLTGEEACQSTVTPPRGGGSKTDNYASTHPDHDISRITHHVRKLKSS